MPDPEVPSDPPPAIPPTTSPRGEVVGAPSLTPVEKLTRNIEDALALIARGRLARQRWQVKVQLVLRILSIVLSSLGSAGVIADRVGGNLPATSGWAFWGSAVILLFGIGLQIANELRIAQIAADSVHVADRCELSYAQLENILLIEDPRRPLADLLVRLMALRENEKYHSVFCELTNLQQQEVATRARALAAGHATRWGQLRPPPQKSKPRRPRRSGGAPGRAVNPTDAPPPANGANADEHEPNR